MGRKVKQLKNYTTEQVEALIESNDNFVIGNKLLAIKQFTKGYSSRYLENFYGVSFKQICNWADRFDAEGIEGLRIKHGRGRKAIMTDDQKHQLQGVMLENPEKYGYNTANWSGALVLDYVRRIFGVTCKIASIYNLMHELGFSFQRAKAVYPERDEQKRKEAKIDIKKL